MSNDSSAGVGDATFVEMVKSRGKPPKGTIEAVEVLDEALTEGEVKEKYDDVQKVEVRRQPRPPTVMNLNVNHPLANGLVGMFVGGRVITR